MGLTKLSMPHEDLIPQILLSQSDSVCDTLIVHERQLYIAVFITYRPPDVPNYMGKVENCPTNIEVLVRLEDHISVLLMVDFNLTNLRWLEDLCLPEMTENEQGQLKSLWNLTKVYYMRQIVLEPTY